MFTKTGLLEYNPHLGIPGHILAYNLPGAGVGKHGTVSVAVEGDDFTDGPADYFCSARVPYLFPLPKSPRNKSTIDFPFRFDRHANRMASRLCQQKTGTLSKCELCSIPSPPKKPYSLRNLFSKEQNKLQC